MNYSKALANIQTNFSEISLNDIAEDSKLAYQQGLMRVYQKRDKPDFLNKDKLPEYVASVYEANSHRLKEQIKSGLSTLAKLIFSN